MTRQHHPFINPNTGEAECLYAGCGKVIPADHYLCKRHYAQMSDGAVEPCPGLNCRRFKSIEYDCCVDCSKLLEPESEPHWAAGDEGCGEFYVYLLVNPAGEWYAGHTRDLRVRLWRHRAGECKTTAGRGFRLSWFEVLRSRNEASRREQELKRMLLQDSQAVISMVLRFRDAAAELGLPAAASADLLLPSGSD